MNIIFITSLFALIMIILTIRNLMYKNTKTTWIQNFNKKHSFKISMKNYGVKHPFNPPKFFARHGTAIDPNVNSMFMNSIKEVIIPGEYITKYSLVDFKQNQYKIGCLNPLIRNQGLCGCCWAMTCIGIIESLLIINHSLDYWTQLSVQQFIDCVSGTDASLNKYGCFGMSASDALNRYFSSGETKIGEEKYFPYELEDSENANYIGCSKYIDNKLSNISIPNINVYTVINCQEYLKQIIFKYGPVFINMSVKKYPEQDENPFFLYDSGIFTDNAAGFADVDIHAMILVGWGELNSEKYWICKNSYGENWGVKGYIYLPIDNTPEGFSNLASEVTFINLQRNCIYTNSSAVLTNTLVSYNNDEIEVSDIYMEVTITAVAYIANPNDLIVFKLQGLNTNDFVNINNEIIDDTGQIVSSNPKYFFNSEKGDSKSTESKKNNWFVYKNKFKTSIEYATWKVSLDIINNNKTIFTCQPLTIQWYVKIYILNYESQILSLYPLTPVTNDIYMLIITPRNMNPSPIKIEVNTSQKILVNLNDITITPRSKIYFVIYEDNDISNNQQIISNIYKT